MKKLLIGHLQKIGALGLDCSLLLFGKNFYKSLGKFNKNEPSWTKILFIIFEKMNKLPIKKDFPIRAIFNVYPAEERHRANFVYAWHAKIMQKKYWRLMIMNVLCENGKYSLVFAFSALPEQFKKGSPNFKNGKAKKYLKKVHNQRIKISTFLGTSIITRSGVLPSVEKSLGVYQTTQEVDTTVIGVYKATQKKIKITNLAKDTPLVIFGARGYVGKKLVSFLRENGYTGYIFAFDKHNGDKYKNIFSIALENIPHIIIDLSGEIAEYVPYFCKNSHFINEAYPILTAETVNMIISITGNEVHHIGGIKGWSLLPLAQEYPNCIPLCASLEDPYKDTKKDNIVLVKITTYLKDGKLKNKFHIVD